MIYSKDKIIAMRGMEISDLELVQSWRNNDNIRRYFREYREFSMTQKEEWYFKMTKDNSFEMFVIIDCISNETIGVSGLTYIDWVNKHADVHFYIGKEEAWIDEKYAPIAIDIILDYGFNTIGLNKLWSEIYEIDNLKLNFFKNKNFQVDATLREHYYYRGKYYNSHILSLLKKDYST